MAFVAIANFSQRSYELGYTFKFMRIMLIVLIQLLNFIGFAVGLGIFFLLLATNKTVNGRRSYLYPLIPFNGRALLSQTVRLGKRRTVGESSGGVRRGGNAEKKSDK